MQTIHRRTGRQRRVNASACSTPQKTDYNNSAYWLLHFHFGTIGYHVLTTTQLNYYQLVSVEFSRCTRSSSPLSSVTFARSTSSSLRNTYLQSTLVVISQPISGNIFLLHTVSLISSSLFWSISSCKHLRHHVDELVRRPINNLQHRRSTVHQGGNWGPVLRP